MEAAGAASSVALGKRAYAGRGSEAGQSDAGQVLS